MKNTGDHRRVQRVEREIQNVVAMYLISGFSEPLDYFVSVTKVIMAGDLKSGKIYFSMMDRENSARVLTKEDAVETESILSLHAHEIQEQISRQLKLRFTPKLKFFFDESLEKVLRVDEALSKVIRSRTANNEGE